ncbi:PH domain-containing protein [Streptomyces sp. NPDC088400]|uniref:PH domain-containing protein n=1 Tax=Streptomyces sp. NPDC088400 TaxID=3365861 RepID=UPI003805BA83
MPAPGEASAPGGAPATYADRVYRSAGGILGGVLLLVIVGWLGGDALFRGTGRAPWLALAGLLFVVPLIIAFSLRPAVYAGQDRLRIRNPFRTISLPWASVTDVRATFSCEVFTENAGKFQMWAVPVSLRQRKRANRRQARLVHGDPMGIGTVGIPRGRASQGAGAGADEAQLALADRTVAELRELAERSAARPTAQGEPTVRWAYGIIAPAVAGLVVLLVLLLTG